MIPRSAWVAAALLCLGLAAGGFALALRPSAHSGGDPVSAAGPAAASDTRSALAAYESRLHELDRALARERDERAALAREVVELRRRLDERVARAATEPRPRGSRATAESAATGPGKDAAAERRARGFDVDAMVAAGFPAAKVRAFKEKMDQIELDRLYLRDLAAREGWLDTPRFREEDIDVDEAVRQARDELGDEFYDWMLYTSGHPNRVRVGDVLEGSAAAAAGLRPGDLILSYGEQRIFSPGELRDSTTTGTAGDSTLVSLLRDGREMQVAVPRGPLGVRVDLTSEEPPPAG